MLASLTFMTERRHRFDGHAHAVVDAIHQECEGVDLGDHMRRQIAALEFGDDTAAQAMRAGRKDERKLGDLRNRDAGLPGGHEFAVSW